MDKFMLDFLLKVFFRMARYIRDIVNRIYFLFAETKQPDSHFDVAKKGFMGFFDSVNA